MRRTLSLAALALLLAAGGSPARAQSLEDEIKAAFLYNFAKFVDWPPDAFASPEEPLTFCVLGRDPFGRALDDLLAGERVKNRPLAVRRQERNDPTTGCHVLFVSPSERTRFEALLRGVDTDRVLTVSDSLEFLAAGGHITFFVEASRVRFAVNREACDKAAFRLSSKLLQVAREPATARAR